MAELSAEDDSRIVLPDGTEFDLNDLTEDELLELYQTYDVGLSDENSAIGTVFGGDFASTFLSCVGPTTWQTVEMAGKLFSLCLILRLFTLLNLPEKVKHFASCVCGLAAFMVFFGEQSDGQVVSHLAVLCITGYILLHVTPQARYKGGTASLMCVVYLLTCELFVVGSEAWNTIKGSLMILSMKIISLAFDIEQGIISSIPNLVEYSGYVLCPSSIIFGPFMMYGDYCQILRTQSVSVAWIVSLTCTVIFGFAFLIMSTCVCPWLFPAESNKWLLAYQTALSFRCSNYFVGYLSESSCLLCGIGTVVKKDDEETVEWKVPVSRPHHIEFPRSFIEIAIHWSVPYHVFLKNYVYKRARQFGPFLAIILTFSASSILHGLNFQTGAVLISIGTYAYVEHDFRKKLSRHLSMCVEARRCKPNCEHSRKDTNYWTTVINLGFGFLNVFHLAYLGVMFDGSSPQDQGFGVEHTLKKWSDLNFLSHWVVLAMYLISVLL